MSLALEMNNYKYRQEKVKCISCDGHIDYILIKDEITIIDCISVYLGTQRLCSRTALVIPIITIIGNIEYIKEGQNPKHFYFSVIILQLRPTNV